MNLKECTRQYKMKSKALNLESEEQKAAYWKKVDSRRLGWANVATKKFEDLLIAESNQVANAISDGRPVESALKRMRLDWEKTMAAVLLTISSDAGEQTAEDLGLKPKSMKAGFDFVAFQALLRKWVALHGAEAVVTIEATRLDELKDIIASGVAENLTNAQIAKNIRAFYIDPTTGRISKEATYKAMRIARTETSAAAGFGQREMARASGFVKKKKWLSSRDDRVRDTHAAIDGQVRPLDEPYDNGLMYPGDPSVNGSESIMCRCVESYITE